jgi:multiple sugar transport system permease protein
MLAVVLPILFGTAAALVFHREFPFRGLLRTIFVMPMMATPVAVALVWTMMFHPAARRAELSALAGRHRAAGLGLRSPNTVIPTLILVEVWHWTPLGHADRARRARRPAAGAL